MHTLTVLAFHLFGFSLLFGILWGISDNIILKRIFIILFCSFIANLLALLILVPKVSKSPKPLTELIFSNDSIKTIKIYKEKNNRWSVDFNNITSYDDLCLDSLKLAIQKYPKSIYLLK